MENTLKVNPQLARQIVYGFCDEWQAIEVQIVDQRRWVVTKEGVFERLSDHTFWRVYWDVGSTEMQDIEPFECASYDIIFTQVELKQVLVEKWCTYDPKKE